jgi:hypothetical protein
MAVPTYRKLKGYAFDPSFASTINQRQSNEVIYKVPWENTKQERGGASRDIPLGPSGEYIEIIDYDPTKRCFYEAIDFEDEKVLADHGLPLSEGDPRFHQQQVYAVVMSVIHQFEKALGRKIIWSQLKKLEDGDYKHVFIPKLRIYPHAMRQQNAYYSPDKSALLFGYFQSARQWSGNNVPGTTVFTCLSPDIVAHEVTHAILDSLHPYLTKDTNQDMLAFHEGFADIIALLQRFTFRSVVEEQIRNSKGDLLSPQNLLGDLAIQFGQAVSGNRRALRSFLVEGDGKGGWKLVEPDPTRYHTETEPHSRGALLVATVFDAFVRLYRYQVADLLRLASDGTGILRLGEIHPDLVKRLSFEACEIANKLLMVCIRALDYCPPTDLNFSDYLRALITSDLEHNPDDEEGLRFALLEAFRSWGIVPNDVNTYSVESLMWKPLDEYYQNNPHLKALQKSIKTIFNPKQNKSFLGEESNEHNIGKSSDIENKPNKRSLRLSRDIEIILRENNRKKIFKHSLRLGAVVHEWFSLKFSHFQPGLEHLLGMCFQNITYTLPRDQGDIYTEHETLWAAARDKFQVYRCRPIIRQNTQNGQGGKVLLITFLQKVFINLVGSKYEYILPSNTSEYEFRGGCTLVIDLATFDIKYALVKNIASGERLKRQLDFALNNSGEEANAALLMQGSEPFAALHFH